MFGTAVKFLLFYLRHREQINAWTAEHADPLDRAFEDAKPIINDFLAEEMPGHQQVKAAVAIAKSARSNAPIPAQGDPENWNPNAG